MNPLGLARMPWRDLELLVPGVCRSFISLADALLEVVSHD
jgi:hypothetical protein